MDSTKVTTSGGDLLAALANAVVHSIREYTGRGPTKARASFTNDILVVAMQDTLTKGERSLADSGKENMVLEIRRCFQDAMEADLVSRVEELTGRKVLACMSTNHVDPDMGVEIFVLEAVPDEGVH